MAWYKTGTVAVTNNSTTVTGSGTTWAVSVAPGDLFTLDGTKVYEIESVNSNTSLSLATPWTGSTLTGQAYAVARLSTVAISTVTLANQVSGLLTDWQTRENEYRAWLAGDPLGGYRVNGTPADPVGNDPLAGYYPLTDLTGLVVYAPCPAKLTPAASAVFTGPAKFSSGAAAAPSLADSAYPGTGLLFPAANTLAAATAGVERWRTTAAGNLVIGKTAAQAVPLLQVGFGNSAASPAYTSLVDVATFSAGAAGVVHVQAPTTSGIGFSSDTVRSAGYVGYTHATNLMEFRTNQTACMWLSPGGLLSLGSQGAATDVLSITKTIGATNTAGIRSILTQSVGDSVSNSTFGADLRAYSMHTSGTISNIYGVRSVARATGAGGAVAALYGFYAQVDAPSGTPNVTTAVGLYINDITIPATSSVVGVQSQISSGTGKWNIYSGGSAANYFAGNALFGSTVQTTGAEKVQITSSALALSVRADTADTTRLWRPISSASAAAGRLVFGAWNASSAQADYASIGAVIEVNTASAHAGALLFNVAAAGTIAEQMRLTSAGRLILGLTADPGYTSRLHVEGGISLNNTANGNPRVFDYYLFGSFTATATGMTTSPTGTVKYTRSGNIVVLEIPTISGISNDTAFTLTGMPTHLRPASNKDVFVRVRDDSAAVYSMGICTIGAGGTLYLFPTPNGGTWTNSNTKTVGTISFSYTLQ